MTDWWKDYPWRLIQTNLREIDMRDINAAQVVKDLQAFQASVLMINAAGIIASYPTKLPYHFQSPYLTGDSLPEILAACHAAGIRVIARTDFSKVRRPIYEQHPGWAYLSPQGKIVDYNGDVHVCVNSPYQQECMLAILEELLSTHDFDGVFFNMSGYQTHDYSGNYYGICHCAGCRTRFREMFALDLPPAENPSDPVFRKYEAFKHRTLQAHAEKVYDFLANGWPHLCIANLLEAGRGFIRQESNTAMDRPLPHWQYSASENTKWAVGSYPAMVSSNTSVDFIDFPCRHVAVSPHQQALRLAQNLANGGALDYYLIGRLDNHADRSGFTAVRDMFHYHAAHEKAYARLRSQAPIALLKPGRGPEAEYRGWFRVLAENHFLFDVLTVEAAPGLSWDRYRAFVVPGIQELGGELAGKLDDFVRAGGILIASGLAGLNGETGEAPALPALRCLGIEQVLVVRKEMRSTYFQFTEKSGFEALAETDLVYMDSPYLYAQYAPDARLCLRLIPPHKFGPPERCYYEQVTDYPAFVTHPFVKGRALTLPWQPGALFYRQGHTNTALFLAALLENIAGLEPVGGNLPPAVEVTHFEKADGSGALLHLVNTSGHYGNSFYAPLPLHGLELSLPCAHPPAEVAGLRSGQALEHAWQDGRLAIKLPPLELFEAIQLTYKGEE
jgi:hypothetical protein